MTEHLPLEPNRIYSREEVAEILGVSLSTVKRMIASGHLRVSVLPGMRRVLIRGQHILDMLEQTKLRSRNRKPVVQADES